MGIFDEISDWVHDLIDPGDAKDLADAGIDPNEIAQGGAANVADAGDAADAGGGMFPNSSGSAAMDQVNQSMETANQAYDEGMEIAEEAPKMPSAGEQAQGMIDGVMNASPEQLDKMEGTLGALNASDEITQSVGESQQNLLDSNAAHEAIQAADQAEIDAESVSAGAEEAADDAESAL